MNGCDLAIILPSTDATDKAQAPLAMVVERPTPDTGVALEERAHDMDLRPRSLTMEAIEAVSRTPRPTTYSEGET